MRRQVLVATVLALVGFAANSLLARGALGAALIDPASYTVVRLASGAAVLALLTRAAGRRPAGTWSGGVSLAVYAAAFSYSYVRIGAALGALVLFPTVKLTLLAWGLWRGERPGRLEWLGAAVAIAGLVALTLPGARASDPPGVALMALAGVAWGCYTIEGRRATLPLAETAGNFARSLIVALPLAVTMSVAGRPRPTGLLLACVSGALASGLAYSLWYRAVPRLSAMQAGLAQLAVPALATLAAVPLLGEQLDARIGIAAAAIFGGLGLALIAHPVAARAKSSG